MVDKFINIFEGLKRAHGCTYINSVPKNGAKLKTKSFVKREIVIHQHFEDHLNELKLSLEPLKKDLRFKTSLLSSTV